MRVYVSVRECVCVCECVDKVRLAIDISTLIQRIVIMHKAEQQTRLFYEYEELK